MPAAQCQLTGNDYPGEPPPTTIAEGLVIYQRPYYSNNTGSVHNYKILYVWVLFFFSVIRYYALLLTAALSGADSGSGVKELRYWIDNSSTTVVSGGSAGVGVNTDGVTVNLRAIDDTGNGSELASTTVQIDADALTISGSAAPAANTARWNNTDVTITFTCADTLSGVDACEAPLTLMGEGDG